MTPRTGVPIRVGGRTTGNRPSGAGVESDE